MPYPPVSGGRIRVYNVIRELSHYNDIYLISFIEDPEEKGYIEELQKHCVDVELIPVTAFSAFERIKNKISFYIGQRTFITAPYISRLFRQKTEEFLSKYQIDIIQYEHSYMDVFDISCWQEQGLKKILVQHNLEYKLVEQHMRANRPKVSLRKKLEEHINYVRFRNFELRVLKNQDLCVAMSEWDRQQLTEFLPDLAEKTVVIPNGVDIDYFSLSAEAVNQHILIFTGYMKYFANEDGILWFYNEIFPRITAEQPNIKVYIVGREPTDSVRELQEKDNRFIVTGFVNDIRDYLYKSAVFFCPLRMGSGTRLKVLEAMAAGIPMVSTSIGCEGIQVTDGDNILMADTAEEFAAKVVALLRNDELRKRLSQSARSLVERKYSWKRIVAEYQKELEKLVRS